MPKYRYEKNIKQVLKERRKINFDVEEEIKKAIDTDQIGPLFTKFILKVDELTKYVQRYDRSKFQCWRYFGERSGSKICIKLSELELMCICFRKVMYALRKHRRLIRKLEKEEYLKND